jgi:multidrug efflux pump subunit AcrB
MESLPWRERYLDKLANWYSEKAGWIMQSARTRIISILSPLVLLILSFLFLSPFIGFKLYPTGDAEAISFTFTAKKGTTTDKMKTIVSSVEPLLAKVPEAVNYYFVIDKNVATANVRLLKKDDRDRSSFEIEDGLTKSFGFLLSKGIKIESK